MFSKLQQAVVGMRQLAVCGQVKIFRTVKKEQDAGKYIQYDSIYLKINITYLLICIKFF